MNRYDEITQEISSLKRAIKRNWNNQEALVPLRKTLREKELEKLDMMPKKEVAR